MSLVAAGSCFEANGRERRRGEQGAGKKEGDEGDRNAQLLGQGHGCSESLCRDGRVMAVNRQVQPQAGVAVFSFLWHV